MRIQAYSECLEVIHGQLIASKVEHGILEHAGVAVSRNTISFAQEEIDQL